MNDTVCAQPLPPAVDPAKAAAGAVGGRKRRPRVRGEHTRDPRKFEQAMRTAAFHHLRGGTWREAAEMSGISYHTLRSWAEPVRANQPSTQLWRSVLRQVAAELGELDHAEQAAGVEGVQHPEVLRIGKAMVHTEGFATPEQLCDHYALHAARVQVELMLDPDATRKDRLDASHKVLALGGHSPVNKTVVVSAPLNDPKVVALLSGVLGELKQIPPPPQISVEVSVDA